MQSIHCDICTNPYTPVSRKRVTCTQCEQHVCFACFQKYNLQFMTEYPYCMFCNKSLTQEEMYDCTNNSFCCKWISNRKQYLFDVEMSKIPSSQVFLAYDKVIQQREIELSKLLDEQLSCNLEKTDLNERIRTMHSSILNWKHGYSMDETSKTPQKHVAKCPNDTCKGFVSVSYTCGTCEQRVCECCLKIREEDHVCNEDDKKSIQYIITVAKPCPNCGIFIDKLNGCDQMWCVYCKIGYSWKTNQLTSDTQHIHNPHYFEWLLTNHVTTDTPCRNDFIRSISNKLGERHDVQWMLLFYRLHGHVQYVLNHHYMIYTDNELTNLDLRLLWLKNEIDETKMKTILHRRYKRNMITVDIHKTLNT